MSLTIKSIQRQLLADKKKFGVLLGLAMFGLLLWGRLVINGGVPRTATAKPSIASVAPPADNRPATIASSARKVVEVVMASQVHRDLFVPDASAYQQIEEKKEKPVVEEKSAPVSADDSIKKQQMIRAEARKLSLQSTLLGHEPKAMINRVLMSVGEKIQGFELLEIRSRQVTLQKDGVTVVLEM